MRLLLNGSVVLSRTDTEQLLSVLRGTIPTSKIVEELEFLHKPDPLGRLLTERQLADQDSSLSDVDSRLQYLKALNREIDLIKAQKVESEIIDKTASMMSSLGGANGRAQAIATVRSIARFDVPKAAEWLDEYYKRS